MEQDIRFCGVDGATLAYATVGRGPVLVLPALWISHLELEWGFPEFRGFVTALAHRRTVVRYDRLGSGLSDREADGIGSLDTEVRSVAAVLDALGVRECSLLGVSLGGSIAVCVAARDPERVRALALFGAFAHGEAIAPPALRDALVATVRAHWGAGSRALADIWLPGADAHTRDRFAALQRAAAGADTAAALLESIYATDVRDALAGVRAPALVMHRRGDRAIPFAAGRELAAQLPGARLLPLDGDVHPPWLGDADSVVDNIIRFLAEHHPIRAPRPAPDADGVLSRREAEVLRLVADGLSDREIAERLFLSAHTVHRHVANIRTKLDQPTRAAAAAHAARLGLI